MLPPTVHKVGQPRGGELLASLEAGIPKVRRLTRTTCPYFAGHSLKAASSYVSIPGPCRLGQHCTRLPDSFASRFLDPEKLEEGKHLPRQKKTSLPGFATSDNTLVNERNVPKAAT